MTNIVEFEAYKKLGKILSPEQYGEVIQRTMKNKGKWIDRPIYDVNIVIATAFKNKHVGR